MAAHVFEAEMRCYLCGRGYELEVDRLEQLPPCGTRCSHIGCGGVLFVATASSRVVWGADPADMDFDDDDRPRRGRPRKEHLAPA